MRTSAQDLYSLSMFSSLLQVGPYKASNTPQIQGGPALFHPVSLPVPTPRESCSSGPGSNILEGLGVRHVGAGGSTPEKHQLNATAVRVTDSSPCALHPPPLFPAGRVPHSHSPEAGVEWRPIKMLEAGPSAGLKDNHTRPLGSVLDRRKRLAEGSRKTKLHIVQTTDQSGME